jgi:FkbM family methyltransferase
MGMKHLIERERGSYDRETFNSVRERLSPGDILFDVGAYDGITSVIASEIVGPRSVVIIEPGEMNWGTIRAYWQANTSDLPHATYAGFLSDEDKDASVCRGVYRGAFPPESYQYPVSEWEEHSNFRLLNDRNSFSAVARLPYMKLDTLAWVTDPPRGILMDVEGAELLVLRGAKETLQYRRPFVWASIHPQFMQDRFGHDVRQLRQTMEAWGYCGELLADDHEQHWFFKPREI